MPKEGRPRHGSMAYWHRKRADSEVPHFTSWPDIPEGPKLQGFAGYKAGMTHAFIVDYRPTSTTTGQEVQVPVTVIECPPMRIAAIRFYTRTYEGLRSLGEVWADKTDEELARRLPLPKKGTAEDQWKKVDPAKVEEVRVLMHTQPDLVTGVPKKAPELMETRVGGGTIEQRTEYAKSILGKEVRVTDFAKDGAVVDVAAVTKGKGFQGAVKRHGFSGGPKTHGQSDRLRAPGSRGSTTTPGRVFKGSRGPGHMGHERVTVQNLSVVLIDGERNLIGLRGAIPGPNGGVVLIKEARKG